MADPITDPTSRILEQGPVRAELGQMKLTLLSHRLPLPGSPASSYSECAETDSPAIPFLGRNSVRPDSARLQCAAVVPSR